MSPATAIASLRNLTFLAALAIGLAVTPAAAQTVLQSGQTYSIASGAAGSQVLAVINVPIGVGKLVVKLSGGTGDADLYVRYMSAPTVSLYNCRPYLSGNNEACTFASPGSGAWYVMVRGIVAYTGVNLAATWTPVEGTVAMPIITMPTGTYGGSVKVTLSTATPGATIRYTTDGSTPSGTSPAYTVPFTLPYTGTTKTVVVKAGASKDFWARSALATASVTLMAPLVHCDIKTNVSGVWPIDLDFTYPVPATMVNGSKVRRLTITTSGGTGDADLGVKFAWYPTIQSIPHKAGNNEQVVVTDPTPGTWFTVLWPYGGYFSGVTVEHCYANF